MVWRQVARRVGTSCTEGHQPGTVRFEDLAAMVAVIQYEDTVIGINHDTGWTPELCMVRSSASPACNAAPIPVEPGHGMVPAIRDIDRTILADRDRIRSFHVLEFEEARERAIPVETKDASTREDQHRVICSVVNDGFREERVVHEINQGFPGIDPFHRVSKYMDSPVPTVQQVPRAIRSSGGIDDP